MGGKWCHLPCVISTKMLFEPFSGQGSVLGRLKNKRVN